MSEPVSRSPIAPAPPVRVEAGWEVSGCRSEAALTITDCTPLAKVHLRAPWNGAMAKALGVPFGRADRDGASPEGGWLVVGSGPGEWHVLAPPGAAPAVTDWLGTVAADAAGDLHDDMAPDGAALRAPVAGVATDIVRDDRAGVPSYLLHCERSSGQYLFGALAGAGEPLGIGVDGFRPPGI